MAGKIKLWSTTPGSNSSAPPLGWPEGMAPSTVNNTARQDRASVKEWYEDAEWIDYGHTIVGAAGQIYTISTDVTALYAVGRAIRQNGTTVGLITASSYSAPNTSVTVAGYVPSAAATALELGLSLNSVTRLISGTTSIKPSTYSGNIQYTVNGVLVATMGSSGLTGVGLSATALSVAPVAAGATVLEIGYQGGTAQTSAIDFHTGATAINYDSRIEATGGTGALGGGDISFRAATLTRQGNAVWDAANLTAGSMNRVIALGNISTVGDTSFAIPAGAWKRLTLTLLGVKANTAFTSWLRLNADATALYDYAQWAFNTSSEGNKSALTATGVALSQRDGVADVSSVTDNPVDIEVVLYDVTLTSRVKAGSCKSSQRFNSGNFGAAHTDFAYRSTAALTSIQLLLRNTVGTSPTGTTVNATAGTYLLQGTLGTL